MLKKIKIHIIIAIATSPCIAQTGNISIIEQYRAALNEFYTYNSEKRGTNCSSSELSKDENYRLTAYAAVLAFGENFSSEFCKNSKKATEKIIEIINIASSDSRVPFKGKVAVAARKNAILNGYFLNSNNECIYGYYDENLQRKLTLSSDDLYCGVLRNTEKTANEIQRYSPGLVIATFNKNRDDALSAMEEIFIDGADDPLNIYFNKCTIPEGKMHDFANTNQGYLGPLNYNLLKGYLGTQYCHKMASTYCDAIYVVKNNDIYNKHGDKKKVKDELDKLYSLPDDVQATELRNRILRTMNFCQYIMIDKK